MKAASNIRMSLSPLGLLFFLGWMVIFCVIMLLTACRGQEHDSLAFNPPVFPETKQISVTPLLSSDFIFDNVGTTMEDIGDFMVILSFRENKYFHVFEKETGTYIKSFGNFGRGPGELYTVPLMRYSKEDSKLYVFQNKSGLNYYWIYDKEMIVHGNRVLPEWEDQIILYLDEGKRPPGSAFHFLAWRDKRLFARNNLHRFEVQDTLRNTLYLYDKYPVVPLQQASDSSDFQDSYLRAAVALKPDMRKFVVASNYGCIVEVFSVDASGKIEKEIEKRFHPPIIADNKTRSPRYLSDGQVQGISELSVTDELIYAKYNGNKFYHGKLGTPIKTIAVFDWLGNPIRRYILDWAIRSFFVDEQRNRCYLVGIDTEDEILLGYFDL